MMLFSIYEESNDCDIMGAVAVKAQRTRYLKAVEEFQKLYQSREEAELSSSAAFENLIGTIIDVHYNGVKAGAVEIAKLGQYAENVYFGKKSGFMDQMVSSVCGAALEDI